MRKYFFQILVLSIFIAHSYLQASDPFISSQALDDSAFLDLVQHKAVDFFWNEADPANGLIKDRSTSSSPASIAAVGFGLTAICIGMDHGWIPYQDGRDRILTTLRTFWQKPQGNQSSGIIGYQGFFYHFLEMKTANRTWNCELSSIDTALLMAGVLYVKQYFTTSDEHDVEIRALADSLYYRVDWNWLRNNQPGVLAGWKPESGLINWWYQGYCEAMILYILAIGSPTHPVPETCWRNWTAGYSWQNQYGQSFVVFPPLFGHHYTHCWVDFRDIQDDYMRDKGITYFENSRRATLAQRAYCIANPKKYTGYGENLWGLTACDGPNGYLARGAPPAQNDDGTIAPTAAGGSMPFAPEVCLPALRNMYDTYTTKIWTKYGFCDAFNLSKNWWDKDVIGIDEGPIAIMIENYRSQKVWNVFMQNQDIRRGLERAGFTGLSDVESPPLQTIPDQPILMQNYPNPFNNATTIAFELPIPGRVTLKIFDLLGHEKMTVFDGFRSAGSHKIGLNHVDFPSGTYLYQLRAGDEKVTRKLVVLK
jgi:hypothetical protein